MFSKSCSHAADSHPPPPTPAHRSVPGERFVLRFQLTDEFEEDICSADPWCAAGWFVLCLLTT